MRTSTGLGCLISRAGSVAVRRHPIPVRCRRKRVLPDGGSVIRDCASSAVEDRVLIAERPAAGEGEGEGGAAAGPVWALRLVLAAFLRGRGVISCERACLWFTTPLTVPVPFACLAVPSVPLDSSCSRTSAATPTGFSADHSIWPFSIALRIDAERMPFLTVSARITRDHCTPLHAFLHTSTSTVNQPSLRVHPAP